jgi:hypothetical protein
MMQDLTDPNSNTSYRSADAQEEEAVPENVDRTDYRNIKIKGKHDRMTMSATC